MNCETKLAGAAAAHTFDRLTALFRLHLSNSKQLIPSYSNQQVARITGEKKRDDQRIQKMEDMPNAYEGQRRMKVGD